AGGGPSGFPFRAVRLHEPGSGRVDAPDAAVDGLAAAHIGLGHRPGRPRVLPPHVAWPRRTPDRVDGAGTVRIVRGRRSGGVVASFSRAAPRAAARPEHTSSRRPPSSGSPRPDPPTSPP